MDHGKIEFTRVGSDEVIGEYPFSDGLVQLCRVRLDKAGNKSFEGENMALGYYALFTAGELAKVKGLSLPKPADVTPEDVFELLTKFDAVPVGTPFNENETEEAEANDVNPTGTQAVS